MACVSFPTCPLAMAEAERFLPQFVTKVEGIMHRHGVGDEHIVLRITGCPNGCGRALLAELGLVGKAVGRYNLHLGGNREGTRIPRMYRENINEDGSGRDRPIGGALGEGAQRRRRLRRLHRSRGHRQTGAGSGAGFLGVRPGGPRAEGPYR